MGGFRLLKVLKTTAVMRAERLTAVHRDGNRTSSERLSFVVLTYLSLVSP